MIIAKGLILTITKHNDFITEHTVKFDNNFSPFIDLELWIKR